METTKKILSKLLFFFIGGLILSVIFCINCYWEDSQNNFRVAQYYIFLFALAWELSRWITSFIDKKLDWIEQPLRKSLVMLGAHILVLGSASFLLTYTAFILMDQRPVSFSNSGYLFIYFMPVDHTLVGLFFGLFRNSRNFLLEWKESINKVEKLERQQAEYQLQALKNQVNPHFLFNNLNTLLALIAQDPTTAEKFGHQLSLVYRYLLEEKDKNIIPIEKELDFLESYIYLLKIRFGENLNILLPTETLKKFLIAPFTLQLLLENAIKHNEVSTEKPLNIEVFKKDGYLIVKNNVQAKSKVGYSSGIGLQNIINRYELLTVDSVLIEENIDTFIVKLPLIFTT